MATLKKIHSGWGLFHLVSALVFLGVTLGESVGSVPVVWRHWGNCTADGVGTCQSETTVASHELNLAACLVAASLVSAFVGHGWSVLYYQVYIDQLEHGAAEQRWVDYLISSPLMMVVFGYLCGVDTAMGLTHIALVQAAVIMCGWVSDIHKGRGRLFFLLGSLLYMASIGTILKTYSLAPDIPLVVHFVVAFILLLFSSFGVLQGLVVFGVITDPRRIEHYYCILSGVSKTGLQWLLYASLIRETWISSVAGALILLGVVIGIRVDVEPLYHS